MHKPRAEQSNTISIFWLRKNGSLIPRQLSGNKVIGTITWSSGRHICFEISTSLQEDTNDQGYLKLSYSYANQQTGENEYVNLHIPLTVTSCNYGYMRYWFRCPLSKNGQFCGRRVGVLYSIGKYFGCRHCGEIAYTSQLASGKNRWYGISIKDIDKAEQELKRWCYRGKLTRKHRRLIKMNEKFGKNFMAMAKYLKIK